MSDYQRSDGLAALSRYLIGEETLAETLTRVTATAQYALSADMAGITMLVEGKPATAVFTDSDAPEIDAHQYGGGSGPCLEAFRTNRTVTIDSVEDDERWPEFTRVAASHGIASTLSLPLTAREEPLGALNLYARQPNAFNFQDEEIGAIFAAQAAVALANARVYQDAQELNEGLRQALESRATIDYAVGILMAGGGQSPEATFQALVRASQRENRKVRTIAAEIVARTQGQTRAKDQSRSADPA